MGSIELIEKFNAKLADKNYLAKVTSVDDTENHSRLLVSLLNFEGENDSDSEIWARIAVPFSGDGYGAFFIPDVGDEVLVTFINGDSRFPVIIGSLWNGSTRVPEDRPSENVNKWTLTGKLGTRIAIEEESAGNAKISFTTPNGVNGELTDSGGGKVEFTSGGSTFTIDTQGVTVNTSLNVTIQATQVSVSAAMVKVDAGISKFSGVVQADTIITNSIISASYTPGAGNIW